MSGPVGASPVTAAPARPARCFDGTVEVGAEFCVAAFGCRGQRPNDNIGARRQPGQTLADEVAQPTLDPVADNRATDSLGNDESGTWRATCRIDRCVNDVEVYNEAASADTASCLDRRGEILATAQARGG